MDEFPSTSSLGRVPFDELRAVGIQPFGLSVSKPDTPKETAMAFWVYILHCADGSYYTGHTDDLERRIREHHSGAMTSCYTFTRRPLRLLFSRDFSTRAEALAAERQIKGWSRRKKEAMICGDWAEVSRLARPVKPRSDAAAP